MITVPPIRRRAFYVALMCIPLLSLGEGWFGKTIPVPPVTFDRLQSIQFNDAGEILVQFVAGEARPVYWWRPDTSAWELFQPDPAPIRYTVTDFQPGIVAGGAFLWKDSVTTLIHGQPEGYGPIFFQFVNRAGEMAGIARGSDHSAVSMSFFKRSALGGVTQVGPALIDYPTLQAWNDKGQFAGNWHPNNPTFVETFHRGMYFWNGLAMESIQEFDQGIDGLGPTDLNNNSEVVGTYGGGRPFLWSPTRGFVDLRKSDGFIRPRINDGTQMIAGDWFRKDGEWRSTLEVLEGVFGVPDGQVAQLVDVNNSGQLLAIVGTAQTGTYPRPQQFLLLDPVRSPLKLELEPNRILRLGETFAVRITVRHSGSETAGYRFPSGLLQNDAPELLTIGVVDIPESFTLSAEEPERIFRVPVVATGRGVAVLTSSIIRSVVGEPEVTSAATLNAVVTPFELGVKILPKELRLNQTPESDLGPRCKALNAELAAAGQPKRINCIEIEMTVTNASNVSVENVNVPGALALPSIIHSKELENPGVPLTPLRFFPPSGDPINLQDPGDSTVEGVNLAPGETAVFAWLADAYDQNTDPEADNSADLAFKSLVLGSIDGRNVRDLGAGDFSIVDQPLLEWGIRPNAGRTTYTSGQAVRLDGYIENISTRDGRMGRDLVVMVCQTHEGNVGGGYLFDARKLGQRTPRYYEVFELPAEGEGKALDLAAIFHTLPTVEPGGAKIACTIRLWAKDDEGKLTSADSQKILKEGWSDGFEVTLAANRPVFSLRQECENQLGISPFLCGLNEGLVIDATDGAIGLAKFLLEGGKQLAYAGSAIFSHEVWVHNQLWKAVRGDEAALRALMGELHVQYLTYAELGLMAYQGGQRIPMALEEFSLHAVGALDNFYRAIDTGNMAEIQYQVGKFLGANPDLIAEPLYVAYTWERMALALEREVAEDTVAAAGRAASRDQAESLERRILEAERDSNVSNLATALEPGDLLSVSHLRKIYGIGKEQLQLLQKIARDNGVIITFRSRSPLSLDLLKNGLAWPKPQALKFKTINEIDIKYLGYRRSRKARIDIVEPPESLIGKVGDDLDFAVDDYMDRLRQVRPELAQNSVLFDEVKERLKGRAKEWNKLTPELHLRDTPDPSEIEIPVNFGVADQLTPGVLRDLLPDLGANATRKVRTSRTAASDIIDPVTGKRRGTWEVKMSGPDGGNFRDVTGDVDFMAILETGGGFIRNPFRRRKIYAQLAAALDMQHGESFAFFAQTARQEWLNCCTLGGEAMVAIAPFGDQAPRAAYFVDNLSVMEHSPNARFLPPRQILRDEGGRVIMKDGVPLEARRPNPTGEFPLIAGADVNSKIDLNFANVFFPRTVELTLEHFSSLRPFLIPAGLARLLGRGDNEAVLSRDPGAPVLQAVAGEEGGPMVFRVWDENDGWRIVDVTEAVSLGGPGVLDMAPMTSLPLGAEQGSNRVEILSREEMGALGEFFAVGDRVILNPGGTNMEEATVREEGSLIFAAGLRFDHQAGEMVASLGPDAGDRDGDGLAGLEELALGTDPGNADTDGDGVPDGTEVARGTDPLTPASDMQIVSIQAGPDFPQVTVLFRGVAGRTYRLEGSRSLTLPEWHDLGPVAGSNALDVFSTPNPFPGARQAFFRFRLTD